MKTRYIVVDSQGIEENEEMSAELADFWYQDTATNRTGFQVLDSLAVDDSYGRTVSKFGQRYEVYREIYDEQLEEWVEPDYGLYC